MHESSTKPDAEDPSVTIAIPVRNGGELLTRALEAIASQKTDRRVEVIALDSGSTDGSLEALRAHGVRVIEIPAESFDWGRAREQLFEEARGEIVVHLSQDAVPAGEDWLERILAPLEDAQVAVSCGSSIPDPARAFPQFQWERNGYHYFTREMRKFRERYGRGLSFANAAVRRAVWEELRIEPQATGEDFQFQTKLHGSGWKIAFPGDAAVLHHHDYTLRAVYRRCRNEGLALRAMGCPYHEGDLLSDLVQPAKTLQWLREIRRGSLRSPAEWLYPLLRPVAVYHGSRFARRYIWY